MSWNDSNNVSTTSDKSTVAGGHVRPPTSRARSLCHGILAGLLVAALCGAALWWFSGSGSNSLSNPTVKQPNKPAKRPYIAPVKRLPTKTGDKLKDALANVEAQGELVKIDPKDDAAATPSSSSRPKPKSTFKTGAEQLMGWLVSVEPGDMPLPIPNFSTSDRAHLAEILISKNEVKEDDSEQTAALKQDVDYLKKEMAKFIKEGGDPNDFMQYYFDQLKSAFDTRRMVARQYENLKDEDPDLAHDFLKRANKLLDDKGIKNIRDVEAEEDSTMSEQTEMKE